jgi:hypothetical protein
MMYGGWDMKMNLVINKTAIGTDFKAVPLYELVLMCLYLLHFSL